MPSLIADLTPTEQERLLEDLNYLNTGEIRGFCRRHGIPWTIHLETGDRRVTPTRDADRKAVVLDRMRTYLTSGTVAPPTVFPSSVVSEDRTPMPAHPAASDRLWYGSYDKHHEGLMAVLADLTDGRFRNGAVARILCRDFWSRGEAPTLRRYAQAWMEADERGLGVDRGEHPEAAWLTDRARGRAGPDWKQQRNETAARVLETLSHIPVPSSTT